MFRRVAFALMVALVVGCAGGQRRDPGAIAAAYAETGRYDEASREIEIAVRAHPEDVKLRIQAAQIQAAAGNVARGVGHLVQAIQISPGDPTAWILLGELEKSRDNIPDACVAFRRAADLAPEDVRAVSGLALAADSLGFDEEAEAAYARWSALEDHDRGGPP